MAPIQYRQAGSNQYGIENLVELGVDAISLSRSIEGAVRDGVQLTDLAILISQFPNILDIAREADDAWRELKDLTPEESAQAAQRIADRSGLPNDGSVLGKVRDALRLAARTHHLVNEAIYLAEDWGALFKKVQPATA